MKWKLYSLFNCFFTFISLIDYQYSDKWGDERHYHSMGKMSIELKAKAWICIAFVSYRRWCDVFRKLWSHPYSYYHQCVLRESWSDPSISPQAEARDVLPCHTDGVWRPDQQWDVESKREYQEEQHYWGRGYLSTTKVRRRENHVLMRLKLTAGGEPDS